MTAVVVLEDEAPARQRLEEQVRRLRPGATIAAGRAVAGAVAMRAGTGVGIDQGLLALAPGGLTEMGLIALAMLVGVGFGTYSSVYVASALALDVWLGVDRRKGIQVE